MEKFYPLTELIAVLERTISLKSKHYKGNPKGKTKELASIESVALCAWLIR